MHLPGGLISPTHFLGKKNARVEFEETLWQVMEEFLQQVQKIGKSCIGFKNHQTEMAKFWLGLTESKKSNEMTEGPISKYFLPDL